MAIHVLNEKWVAKEWLSDSQLHVVELPEIIIAVILVLDMAIFGALHDVPSLISVCGVGGGCDHLSGSFSCEYSYYSYYSYRLMIGNTGTMSYHSWSTFPFPVMVWYQGCFWSILHVTRSSEDISSVVFPKSQTLLVVPTSTLDVGLEEVVRPFLNILW